MRRRLIFARRHFDDLRYHLLSRAPEEEAAVLLAGSRQTPDGVDLFVHEVHPVPTAGFATCCERTVAC